MRKFLSLLVCAMAACSLTALSFGAAAANNDEDGFVWLDANTKIKLTKPVSAASGAGAPAPEKGPKEEKKEKTRK